jgi:hypothetical protein
MILNMIVGFLRNGFLMALMRKVDSTPFLEKGFGEMKKEEDYGGLFL